MSDSDFRIAGTAASAARCSRCDKFSSFHCVGCYCSTGQSCTRRLVSVLHAERLTAAALFAACGLLKTNPLPFRSIAEIETLSRRERTDSSDRQISGCRTAPGSCRSLLASRRTRERTSCRNIRRLSHRDANHAHREFCFPSFSLRTCLAAFSVMIISSFNSGFCGMVAFSCFHLFSSRLIIH